MEEYFAQQRRRRLIVLAAVLAAALVIFLVVMFAKFPGCIQIIVFSPSPIFLSNDHRVGKNGI